MITTDPPTEQPAGPTSERPVEMRRIDRVVDAGFLVLVVVCAVRYVTRHGSGPMAGGVLTAAVLCLIAYGIGVLARPGVRRQQVGITAATLIWIPLVIVASSFAWCAFALFFAVHRVHRGRIAPALTAAVVVAVGISLYVLSDGRDLGLVLGPVCGGLLLSMAYATLQRLFTARSELIMELTRTRDQLAASERSAGALTERHRVAVELHDTVVQGTASALLLLEAAEQTWPRTDGDDRVPGAAQIREAEAVLRGNLTQTRRIVHRLGDADPSAADLPAMITDATAPLGRRWR